jgi:hypothetical protein
MKTIYNYFISTIISLIFASLVHGVIILQLPGVSIGTNEQPTIDIDFLDKSDSVVYTLKGEILTKTYPEQKQSAFLPDKLTGSVKFIKKIRIKAAESGMLLRLFDDPTASLPKFFLQMKTSYLMDRNKPIEIDAIDSGEFNTNPDFLFSWNKRDTDEMSSQHGFHIAKIEVNVQRNEQPPLQPVLKFGVISAPQNNLLMPDNLVAGAKGVSLIQSPNAVYLGPPSSSSPNFYLNMAQPQPQIIAPPPPQIQQFPNAPAFL